MPVSPATTRCLHCLVWLLFCFFFLGMASACTKAGYTGRNATHDSTTSIPMPDTTGHLPGDPPQPLPAMELLNEHYGDDPQQVMDIYLPAGRSAATTRMMVFIHGGGWMGSDKRDFTPHIDNMKNRDAKYAYVNLNYRLVQGSKHTFPAAEEDINRAMEFLWRKADSFHISRAAGLIGNSAGAHLAALQACKHNSDGYIKAAVCLLGVYDMKRFYEDGSAGVPQLSIAVLGGTPDQLPALYRSSSPLFYVAGNTPPVMLIHGTEDTLARYSQAVAMDSALKKHGVIHELYTFKGGHVISADKINDAAEKMFKFIAKYTK
ncbi:alpha/beta hydrolase [Chitinophaga rhizophila]|uniref:Alpha/beta hydrolase n=1 Tax=Chitinophaga rhizophila TaxID=2866212 RepID=A0ABS7GDZ2_9BACT|nr:alpha/beta hydrolase [Chitinophaga rhizophila]MBW8685500.1 alpha/beta hydrolase [Chitinophaga rhizophila]